MTGEYVLRIARRRTVGGVDTAAIPIEAADADAAIASAMRTMDAYLAGAPGVGVLSDAVGVIWSERRGLPPPAALPLIGP